MSTIYFSIGDESFCNCKLLKKVEFSGRSAIDHTLIESLTIPSEVKLIGKESFASCQKLNKVWIQTDVKY